MSFDVSLEEMVTVAIYEAGVGGENNATNVIRKFALTCYVCHYKFNTKHINPYCHSPSRLSSFAGFLYSTPALTLTLILIASFWISMITGNLSKSTRSDSSSTKSNAHSNLHKTRRNSTHASGRPRQL